jgi:hypothetical protein
MILNASHLERTHGIDVLPNAIRQYILDCAIASPETEKTYEALAYIARAAFDAGRADACSDASLRRSIG